MARCTARALAGLLDGPYEVRMPGPVLLVHSGGLTSRQWRRLGEKLAPSHRVVAPDLLGYGASGAWPLRRPFHFREDVAFLEAKLDELGEAAHLVGHSYGGFLALKLALARPKAVRSLAVYEPVAFGLLDAEADRDEKRALDTLRAYLPGEDGVDEAWLQAFVEWWNGAGAWGALPEETKAAFRSVGWKLSEEVRTLAGDTSTSADYAAIEAPTLVLGGARSPRTERRVIEKLAAALPHGSLKVFEGLGHMGPVSHASLVNEAIAAHIASVELASGEGGA